jgi:hypothetical protein
MAHGRQSRPDFGLVCQFKVLEISQFSFFARNRSGAGAAGDNRSDLTQSVFKVGLPRSTPPQIRQLTLHYY